MHTWERRNSYCEKAWNSTYMSLLPFYYELLWEFFCVKEKSSYITIYRYLSSQALCRAYTNEWALILAFMEFYIIRNQDAYTMLCHDLVKCWGAQKRQVIFTWGFRKGFLSPGWCKCCDRHTKGGGLGRQFTQLDKTDSSLCGDSMEGRQWHVVWAMKNWPNVTEKNQWNKPGGKDHFLL